MKKTQNKKGFTLVEEIVGLLILSILILVASGMIITAFRLYSNNVKTESAQKKGQYVYDLIDDKMTYANGFIVNSDPANVTGAKISPNATSYQYIEVSADSIKTYYSNGGTEGETETLDFGKYDVEVEFQFKKDERSATTTSSPTAEVTQEERLFELLSEREVTDSPGSLMPQGQVSFLDNIRPVGEEPGGSNNAELNKLSNNDAGTSAITVSAKNQNQLEATIGNADDNSAFKRKLTFTESVGDKIYLKIETSDDITYAKGIIGFSVQNDNKWYWVAYIWEWTSSNTSDNITVLLDNIPEQVILDEADITDSDKINTLKSEAKTCTTAEFQVWNVKAGDQNVTTYVINSSESTTTTSESSSGGGSSEGFVGMYNDGRNNIFYVYNWEVGSTITIDATSAEPYIAFRNEHPDEITNFWYPGPSYQETLYNITNKESINKYISNDYNYKYVYIKLNSHQGGTGSITINYPSLLKLFQDSIAVDINQEINLSNYLYCKDKSKLTCQITEGADLLQIDDDFTNIITHATAGTAKIQFTYTPDTPEGETAAEPLTAVLSVQIIGEWTCDNVDTIKLFKGDRVSLRTIMENLHSNNLDLLTYSLVSSNPDYSPAWITNDNCLESYHYIDGQNQTWQLKVRCLNEEKTFSVNFIQAEIISPEDESNVELVKGKSYTVQTNINEVTAYSRKFKIEHNSGDFSCINFDEDCNITAVKAGQVKIRYYYSGNGSVQIYFTLNIADRQPVLTLDKTDLSDSLPGVSGTITATSFKNNFGVDLPTGDNIGDYSNPVLVFSIEYPGHSENNLPETIGRDITVTNEDGSSIQGKKIIVDDDDDDLEIITSTIPDSEDASKFITTISYTIRDELNAILKVKSRITKDETIVESEVAEIPVSTKNIDLSSNTATVMSGKSVNIITGVDSSVANRYTLVSADDTKLTAHNSGVVTAAARIEGSPEVIVTAKYTMGSYEKETPVTVTIIPFEDDLEITNPPADNPKLTLVIGNTAKITTNKDTNAVKPNFSSNKDSVATVNADGNVTAVAVGSAVIKVQWQGQEKRIEVVVKQSPIVTVNEEDFSASITVKVTEKGKSKVLYQKTGQIEFVNTKIFVEDTAAMEDSLKNSGTNKICFAIYYLE